MDEHWIVGSDNLKNFLPMTMTHGWREKLQYGASNIDLPAPNGTRLDFIKDNYLFFPTEYIGKRLDKMAKLLDNPEGQGMNDKVIQDIIKENLQKWIN